MKCWWESWLLSVDTVCMLSRSVVSNPLWLHRLQPTRLFCPWDYPGKKLEWVAIFHRIFPAQGSKVHFLQMDSLPLNHLGQAVFPKSLPRIFFPSQQLLKTPHPLSPPPKPFSSPVFSHAKQSTSAIGSSPPTKPVLWGPDLRRLSHTCISAGLTPGPHPASGAAVSSGQVSWGEPLSLPPSELDSPTTGDQASWWTWPLAVARLSEPAVPASADSAGPCPGMNCCRGPEVLTADPAPVPLPFDGLRWALNSSTPALLQSLSRAAGFRPERDSAALCPQVIIRAWPHTPS